MVMFMLTWTCSCSYFTEYPNPKPNIRIQHWGSIFYWNWISESCNRNSNFTSDQRRGINNNNWDWGILYWISESDNLFLFFHFKESYETFSFFMLMFSVQFRIFLFLALAFKEFSFTITNANVYVNLFLFLFHLRSEILIIEGYYIY